MFPFVAHRRFFELAVSFSLSLLAYLPICGELTLIRTLLPREPANDSILDHQNFPTLAEQTKQPAYLHFHGAPRAAVFRCKCNYICSL